MATQDSRAEAENVEAHHHAHAGSDAEHHATGVDAAIKERNLKRLRRIEGQIRGLQRMIDEDTYCIDVLTQVAAATKALESVSLGLLDEHVRHCVREAATSEGEAHTDEMIDEAVKAIARLVRS